jgi:hypothetical protein
MNRNVKDLEKQKYFKFGMFFMRKYREMEPNKSEIKYNFARMMNMVKLNVHADELYDEIIKEEGMSECKLRAILNKAQFLKGSGHSTGKQMNVIGSSRKKNNCVMQAHLLVN